MDENVCECMTAATECVPAVCNSADSSGSSNKWLHSLSDGEERVWEGERKMAPSPL